MICNIFKDTYLNRLLPTGAELAFLENIALPIGISFYTFQGVSYLIDVYRRDLTFEKNFVDFACYLSMFSQLIAGPIVRYSDVQSQMRARFLSTANLSSGAVRFIYGLSKKVLIADTLGVIADSAFSLPYGELSTSAAWLGITCYMLQIYFDFSGYSDMAIGIGLMMGFHFPENFNYPYVARSVSEFWRRWHISLSSWFRDYLYIPLGGNRAGEGRTICNLFIVFLLCGLWHGATFNFVLWGAYHGTFLMIERFNIKVLNRLPKVLQHVYTIFVIMMGWVLFRAETIYDALAYYKALYGFAPDIANTTVNSVWFNTNGYVFPSAICTGIILSTPIYAQLRHYMASLIDNGRSLPAATFIVVMHIWHLSLLVVTTMPLFGATYNAFIYFRF